MQSIQIIMFGEEHKTLMIEQELAEVAQAVKEV